MKRLGPILLCTALVATGLSSCALFRPRAPVYPLVELERGLRVQDLLVPLDPSAPTVEAGLRVTLDYEARLAGGERFDSSLERGEPIQFTVGMGEMPLVAMDLGVRGMRVGGRRRILSPAELAFGSEGVPGRVPPDAPVEFVVEVRSVE